MIAELALRAAEAVVAEHAGLRASAATEPRLASSLRDRATIRGVDLGGYVRLLADDADERQALLDLVTVPETSWFRDGQQIEAFVRHVVARPEAPVLVWSVGCATGQEPYSLAIALDEAGIREWRVVASDVSQHAVARTREATYARSELRGLSPARAGRYLQRTHDRFTVTGELRDRVLVFHHNLAVDDPPVGWGTCTAVFCRNLLIYVCRDRIAACLARIRERLAPDGLVFLGAAETLGPAAQLTVVRLGDVFAYAPPARPTTSPATPAAAAPMRPAPLRRSPMPAGDDLRRHGEEASRRGDHAAAVIAFQRAVYIDRNDVAAHLGLGFSLEALGDGAAGHRAFLAARDALDRVGAARAADAVEGYGADAVRVVLAAKLGAGASR